jgi:DNA-binding transcriptional regulator YiaG
MKHDNGHDRRAPARSRSARGGNSAEQSLGAEIIAGLSEFSEALKKGEVRKRFAYREIAPEFEPTAYSPELVRSTRKLLRSSVPLFARFLGATADAVRSWEQGMRKAPMIACRFMDEIRNDPDYWLDRFESIATANRDDGTIA